VHFRKIKNNNNIQEIHFNTFIIYIYKIYIYNKCIKVNLLDMTEEDTLI
jgi:hypothetical protein